MAIAGLHIGVCYLAGFTYWLFSWLWGRIPNLALWFPAQLAGAFASLMTAIIYSGLAGFSIPTQRACIMLSIFIMTLLSRRKINPWHSWSLALFMVLN